MLLENLLVLEELLLLEKLLLEKLPLLEKVLWVRSEPLARLKGANSEESWIAH